MCLSFESNRWAGNNQPVLGHRQACRRCTSPRTPCLHKVCVCTPPPRHHCMNTLSAASGIGFSVAPCLFMGGTMTTLRSLSKESASNVSASVMRRHNRCAMRKATCSQAGPRVCKWLHHADHASPSIGSAFPRRCFFFLQRWAASGGTEGASTGTQGTAAGAGT